MKSKYENITARSPLAIENAQARIAQRVAELFLAAFAMIAIFLSIMRVAMPTFGGG